MYKTDVAPETRKSIIHTDNNSDKQTCKLRRNYIAWKVNGVSENT